MDYTVHGILQARVLDWIAFPFSRKSSQLWIEPRSPALQVDSLPVEPQGKPKNTAVGSPGGSSDAEIESGSPALHADSLPTELSGKPQTGEWGHQSRYLSHAKQALYHLS